MCAQYEFELNSQHDLCSKKYTRAFMLFPTPQVAYTLRCFGAAMAIAGEGINAHLAKVISIQVVPLVLILGGRGS